jgi:hypothetical protein
MLKKEKRTQKSSETDNAFAARVLINVECEIARELLLRVFFSVTEICAGSEEIKEKSCRAAQTLALGMT